MSFESLVVDCIEGKKKNFFLLQAFSLCSILFKFLCKVRHFCYDKKLLKSRQVSCPVISIGNLVAGGTGKTPFVQLIVKELSKKNIPIAILSRGYRSKKTKKTLQVSSGVGPMQSVESCGDEAYWLAKETNASIFIGKDRIASAKKAIQLGSKLLILEDGMQHRRLKRDIEIVLLHAADLFGKGHFLPMGYLRDFPSRLKKASLIIVTHLEEGASCMEILQKIRVFTEAPVVGFSASYHLQENIAGQKIGAFCGIAKPFFFYKALEGLGGKIVQTLSSEDHMLPVKKNLEDFARNCKEEGVACLVCTEKDYVKLNRNEILGLPVFALKMNFRCVWNENLWQEFCQSIGNCYE